MTGKNQPAAPADPHDAIMRLTTNGMEHRDWCNTREAYLYGHRDARHAAAELVAAATTAPAPVVPLVQQTAPERIWLEISEVPSDADRPFADGPDVTWSRDEALNVTVPYVRADLATHQPGLQDAGQATAAADRDLMIRYKHWRDKFESEHNKGPGPQDVFMAMAATAAPVPPGYSLVPVEPTALMLRACNNGPGGHVLRNDEIWRAMLAAAPKITAPVAGATTGAEPRTTGGGGAATGAAAVAGGKWDGAEEWMPLAWELCAEECGEEACTELVWEGGPIKEPWGDRWLKYEDEAKRLIALVRKHAPQAVAQPLSDEQITKACEDIWGSDYGCTLSEELQRVIARAIERAHGIGPAGGGAQPSA